MNLAEKIYNELLKHKVEVILDDREERAGVKLKDADLIGIPYRITIGKAIKDNLVEFKTRSNNETILITPEEAIQKLISL